MRTLLPAADLFDTPALPRGLEYHADFLSADDEATLLRTFVDLPFHEAKFQQYTARRRVDRYGLVFDEKRRVWVEGRPLPAFLVDLRDRVAASRRMRAEDFVHALVTEYRPGTPIGWHRDKPEYGIVVGISLASACRMRFRPYDNQHDRSAVVALTLEPRSLYVMADEIRWGWQHSIPPAKALRYSITFRTRVDDARKAR